MQRSGDLKLESSGMLDDLEDAPYTFTSTINEQSTRNEQSTPRYIQSDWGIQLLQQQQAQQLQQQEAQQLQLDIQQAYDEFIEHFELLHQDTGFLNGTDRNLMKSLSQWETPEDPVLSFLWESFPTPSTAPTSPGLESDGTPLIARPLHALLDTDRIHDRVWNTSDFQMIPMMDQSNRTSLDVVEEAFILNNLCCTDQQIIDDYRGMFQWSLVHDQVLLRVISEGRWKAKCVLWLPEELDIIRRAVRDGLLAAITALLRGSNAPSAHKINWSAWKALRDKWAFYPKTYDAVSAKCAEIHFELVTYSW